MATADVLDEARAARRRIPLRREQSFPYPTGWFQVLWSEELEAGSITPIHYFGRPLVLYRSASGRVHAFDAYCPGCGAHLGYAARVEDDDLCCVVNGWRWRPDGSRVGQGPDHGRLTSWHVRETSGLVVLWFDESERAPFWDPPVIEAHHDPQFYPMYPHGAHRDVVSFPPQYFVENAADMAHILYVHRWADIPNVDWQEWDGHLFRNHLTGTMVSSKGEATVGVENNAYGLGLMVNRLDGVHPTIEVVAVTPIDEHVSEMRMSIWVGRRDGDEGDVPGGVAKAIIDAQVAEVLGDRADRPIWENQIYVDRAPLMPEESGALRDLRRWARNQYAHRPERARSGATTTTGAE